MLLTAQEAKLESDKYNNTIKELSNIEKLIEYYAILGECKTEIFIKDKTIAYLHLIKEILENRGFIIQTYYDARNIVTIKWDTPTTNKSEGRVSAIYANKLYNEYDKNFQSKLDDITNMINDNIKIGKTRIIVTELEPKIKFVLEHLGYTIELNYHNEYDEYDEGYYTIDWSNIKEE